VNMRSGRDERDPAVDATNRPGRCIKGPFGRHRKTGEWCVAVNDGFEEVPDWARLVNETPRVNADEVLADAYMRMKEMRKRGSSTFCAANAEMKPCLREQLETGTVQGLRNETAFALASELRRVGNGENEALAALGQWNQKNRPPLSQRELESVVRSAYQRAEPYEFGCNPNSALRRLVECPGRSNCSYYQGLFEHIRVSSIGK
jgi:hypothetical protein